MVFSSVPFLYYFLPVVLIAYYIVPRKLANGVLLLASLFFYGYGESKYLILIGATVFFGWIFGMLIPKSKIWLYISLVFNLGLLGWFKYADFFIESFSKVTGISINTLAIALPIGISFYTFQIISYLVDVYRGQVKPQKNLINFAMYVTLFPQLIAGPIVVYKSIQGQIDGTKRSLRPENIYYGVCRFILGLGKKVLIANNLGMLCADFKTISDTEGTMLFYWIYAVSFMLQIYFDFSGYSDMAIGMGKLLGFDFPENFNYPLISKSVTEFWRRWHMTLGAWFREYVYIPLGGNRVSFKRWVFNIFVVWGLTGLWHGASLNFVVWGLIHGSFLLLERLFIGRYLNKLPSFVSHIYLTVVVVLSMVIFNADSITEGLQYIAAMFGFGQIPFSSQLTLYYLKSNFMLLCLGILCSTPLCKKLFVLLKDKLEASELGKSVLNLAEPLLLLIMLVVCTAYMVDGSYNPFLYFRF